jgi:hypothetical protein
LLFTFRVQNNLQQLAGYESYARRPPPAATRGKGYQRGTGFQKGTVRGGSSSRTPSKFRTEEQIQKQVYANIGKHLMPKNAFNNVTDIIGHVTSFNFVKATDQDYEDFNEANGYYPGFLHKSQAKVISLLMLLQDQHLRDFKLLGQ